MRIWIIVFLFPAVLSGQDALTGKEFFDQKMVTFNPSAFDQSNPIQFPWFDKVELRTETRDFNLKQQEYTLRLTPSSSSRRKIQEDLYRDMIQKPDFDQLEYECSKTIDLHDDWLKLFFMEKEMAFLQQKENIHMGREAVLNKRINALDFRTVEWVDLKTEKNDLATRIHKLNSKKGILTKLYEMEGENLDFNQFPSIEELIILLGNENGAEPVSVQKKNFEMELAEKELSLEKAEIRQLFDFFQMRYYGPQEEPFREHFSLGMGFILQNSGNNKLKLQELELKEKKIRSNKTLQELEQKYEMEELNKTIQSLYNDYLFLSSTYEKEYNELAGIEERLRQREDSEPGLIFEIRERHVDNQLELLTVEERIYEKILEFLVVSGIMCRRPYHFFLDNSQIN